MWSHILLWTIIISTRTEHLLDVRNVKRGLTRRGVGGEAGRGKEGGRRAPSFILSIAWLGTIIGSVDNVCDLGI